MVLKRTKEALGKAKRRPVEEKKREEAKKIVQEAVYIVDRLNFLMNNLNYLSFEEIMSEVDNLVERANKLYNEYRDTLKELPVKSEVYEVVGVDDPDTARKLYEEAKKNLDEGKVPRARSILNTMRNEIIIDTDLLPIDVLVDSLKLARTYLQRNNLVRFAETITLLLSSFERIQTIIPKPLLEAHYIAQIVLEKYKDDKEMAMELVEAIRARIELARILGYVRDEKDIEELQRKVESVETSIREEKEEEKQIKELQEEMKKVKQEAS